MSSTIPSGLAFATVPEVRVTTGLRFIATALLTSVVNLALNAAVYVLLLKDFYQAHPAGSLAFVQQLNRPPEQLVIWAMVVTSLTMGLLITLVMKWSGARTLATGLRQGAIFGFLFWTAVNSGLYASSNLFSLASVLVDTPCVALCMTLSAGFSVWMLNVKRKDHQ